MDIVGRGRRVRIYTGEAAQWGRAPLFLALLEFLRAEGAAGATVVRGVAGFGATSRIHTATLFRLSEDLPMVIDWVDAPERVERLLPHIREMVSEGLITVGNVQVAAYSHRAVRADVMTREVVTVPPDLSVLETARLMGQRRLKRLPGVDAAGHLLGIVSRVDLLRTVAQGYPAPEQPPSMERPARLVADVLRRDVPTVSLQASLPEVIDAIVSTRLNRAVVVDEQQRVVGLVTDAELVRRLGEQPGIVTRLMRRAAAVPLMPDIKVTDLMIADVVTTRPDVTIEVAMRDMLARKHKILPVVDAEGRLIGIADRFDLLQAIARPDDQPHEAGP